MSFLGKETMKKKLYFGKWNFLALVLRNSLYFLIFEKAEIFEPKPKNKNIHSRKLFYISAPETF